MEGAQSGEAGRPSPRPGGNGEATPEGMEETQVGLWQIAGYFLKLGTIGFGGPVALAEAMRRDWVERRRWISQDEYQLAFAFTNIFPGPMAEQLAFKLGYLKQGVLGATVAGAAFLVVPLSLAIGLAALYVVYGGLWWIQALFYGIGAAVIAVIAVEGYKLTYSLNRRDWLLWAIAAVLAGVTYWTRAELALAFIAAGLLALFVRAPPTWLKKRLPFGRGSSGVLPLVFLQAAPAAAGPQLGVLGQLFWFFAKAGGFVFGSGIAIQAYIYTGTVVEHQWLTPQQFTDAVAVGMITPGPISVDAGFVGYLVAGLPGAVVSALGIFLPNYLMTIAAAPWFKRHRDNPQLKAFAQGATAGAIGAIAGATVLLGQQTITDLPTILIALTSLGLLWFAKLPVPILVVAAGVAGLVIWPLVQGG